MKFDLADQGFRARAERINALLRPWTLVGASGSWLEAHLMARAGLTADMPKLIGSCINADEVLAVIANQPERCLLIAVDSIAPDHGEALMGELKTLPHPPAVLLLLESTDWLRADSYPFGQVDGLLRTESFGSGGLIAALEAIALGQSFVDPALPWLLKERAHGPQAGLKLTPREQETLREIGRGLTNRQIAARLGIAESTTREYTQNLFHKLGVSNRTQLLSKALERGLLWGQGLNREPGPNGL
jgi:DNA-binding NarL/FixJ family response regulator